MHHTHNQPICPYLEESINLFSVGCKGHEPCCQVDQAANHHVLLAKARLMITDEVSAPHHVAVTVLHAAGENSKNTYFCTFYVLVCFFLQVRS